MSPTKREGVRIVEDDPGVVSKQAETEQLLAESEAQLASIIRSAMDAIITIDTQQRITLFNGMAEKMFRCTADQAVGRPVRYYLSERLNLQGHPHAEITGVRADGEAFPLEISVSEPTGLSQVRHTLILRDITERKRLEDQYRQAQKMEAVGRLAGGVAHDFNNLLTIILGYSQILAAELPAGSAWRDLVAQIEKAGGRAADLTRQLLAFSRQQVLQPRVLDLNAVVADMDKMLRRLIGEDIELVTALAPDLHKIKADPGQLDQVIMNLAVNARDAMPDGGKLTLQTGNLDLTEADAGLRPEVQPGPHVMLTVSDTGCGMDAQTLAHIFEPFFTTKQIGKGTGLGLATIYGIIKQAKGWIDVASEPGRGSTFRICLPVAENAPEPAGAQASRTPSSRGQECVLLVEDDEAVRLLISKALQENGYQVLQARDGGEALRISQGREETIHLLLSDIVMPRMGGPELAQQLVRQRPGLKVLYMSGYTGESMSELPFAFLQKPFTPAILAENVRAVLDHVILPGG